MYEKQKLIVEKGKLVLGVPDSEGLIVIPENVKLIEPCAFRNSRTLKKVVIKDGVEFVGHNAFSYCKALREVCFPDSVKEIGPQAFMFSGIEKVRLPKDLKRIRNATFYGSNLKEIDFPKNIEVICDKSFKKCKNIKEIKIPNSIKVLEDSFDFDKFRYLKIEKDGILLTNEKSNQKQYNISDKSEGFIIDSIVNIAKEKDEIVKDREL